MSPAEIIAFFLASVVLWSLYEHEGVCPRCLGRGRHRADCPRGGDDHTHG
jgi:hypothetical protein